MASLLSLIAFPSTVVLLEFLFCASLGASSIHLLAAFCPLSVPNIAWGKKHNNKTGNEHEACA